MKNLKTDSASVLLIGIGNSGRGDDGLGWKFTDMAAKSRHYFIDCEYRYQLQIEDTDLISKYDTVLFVDASHTPLSGGFEIKTGTAAGHYFFSSHMQSPGTLLYLVNDLYNKYPKAYTIAISGYYWDLKTSLSKAAKKNLQTAFDFFEHVFLSTIDPGTGDNNNKLMARQRLFKKQNEIAQPK